MDGKRVSSISRAIAACRARARASAPSTARTSRGRRCSARATASYADLQEFRRARRRRPGGGAAAGARRRHGEISAAEASRRRARLRRSARPDAHAHQKPTRRSGATCRRSSSESSSTSSRIPIRCRPRSCCSCRRPIPTSTIPDAVRPIPGKLFIVGDPKQAIYRFRGTGVETYRTVKEQLAARGGRVLQLTTSYRSVPAIQRFVNAAFADEMRADERASQAEYVALAPVAHGRRLAAGGRGVAGAEAVRSKRLFQGVGKGHRGFAAGRRRRLHRLARRRATRLADRRAAGGRLGAARSASGAAHRGAVPAVRQLRRGRDAQVRGRDRGARHPAPARRRQGVPRARGSRNGSRGARRDRMAGR